MRDVLLDNRVQFYTESMKLQCQNIEYFKKLIENETDYSVREKKIIESLSRNVNDSSIINSLTELRRINLDIIGYTVYSYSGLRYESNNTYNFPFFDIFSKSKEYKTFENNGQDDMWLFCTEDIPKYNYSVTNSPNVITYIRKIYGDTKPIGIVVANIATTSFLRYFSYDCFDSDFSLSLYTQSKEIIYGSGDKSIKVPASSEISKLIVSDKNYMFSNGNKELIIVESILNPHTYIIKTISLDNFYSETYRLKILFIGIAVILLIVLIFFYTRLSQNIIAPLIALHDKMIEYRGKV